MSPGDAVLATIRNAEAVTNMFGRWPSFHDGEIVSLFLSRDHEAPAMLEARIQIFETPLEVRPNGGFVTVVTFRFTGVRDDVSIRWFNEQNVISSLEISASESGPAALRVEMPSIFGADVSFTCDAAEVVACEPLG